jgi:hypothetical protein
MEALAQTAGSAKQVYGGQAAIQDHPPRQPRQTERMENTH